MGRIYNNIIETVGRTPLVKLNKVTAGAGATILLKCEFFNPLGSVKDRIGMSIDQMSVWGGSRVEVARLEVSSKAFCNATGVAPMKEPIPRH